MLTAFDQDCRRSKRANLRTILASLVGVTVLVLTAIWAFAFHSIYVRDEPRIAASRWIFQNIPGPINLHIATNENGTYNQPLPFPPELISSQRMPYQTSFIAQNDGLLKEILLAHVTAVPKQATFTIVLNDLAKPGPSATACLGFYNRVISGSARYFIPGCQFRSGADSCRESNILFAV